MNTEAKTSKPRNFTRNYSDTAGSVDMEQDGAVVLSFKLSDIAESVRNAAALRYLSDICSSVGNAALKDGKSAEEAHAAMAETLAKLADGSFTFRSGAGEGGLSVEEEQRVIAETLVSLQQVASIEEANAVVSRLYSITKNNTKGQTMRPEYNKLKAVPQIKVALANASKSDGGLAGLLKLGTA